jgi:hypothetical protein
VTMTFAVLGSIGKLNRLPYLTPFSHHFLFSFK